jgi:hypothetical protein
MDGFCIAIMALGNIDYFQNAMNFIEPYCKKNLIELHIIREDICNPKKAYASWVKLNIHKIIPNKKFILCWDLDLLPTSQAPNIVAFIDSAKLNMCFDYSLFDKNFNLTKSAEFPNFRFNCGLVGIPKNLANLCEGIYDKYAYGIYIPGMMYPSYEQYYLNDAIVENNLSVNVLDKRWNMFFTEAKKETICDEAYCVHYTWGVTNTNKNIYMRNHDAKHSTL